MIGKNVLFLEHVIRLSSFEKEFRSLKVSVIRGYINDSNVIPNKNLSKFQMSLNASCISWKKKKPIKFPIILKQLYILS